MTDAEAVAETDQLVAELSAAGWLDGQQGPCSAIVRVLLLALSLAPDAARLAAATGTLEADIALWLRRLRKNRVLLPDGLWNVEWFEENGEIALICDALVAQGLLKRAGDEHVSHDTRPASLRPLQRFERDGGKRPARGNHTLPQATIDQIHALDAAGASMRGIARQLGVHKSTVQCYLGRRDRADAMRRWHERRRAERVR